MTGVFVQGCGSTDLFTFFNSEKLQHSIPSPPPSTMTSNKKEGGKMKTACVRAAPNRLRGELDIVSHKNATNTLNGLRVILFGYLHFAIFTVVEGWMSIFRETWGAQVTTTFPSVPFPTVRHAHDRSRTNQRGGGGAKMWNWSIP